MIDFGKVPGDVLTAAHNAVTRAGELIEIPDRLSLEMDLCAAHLACPLDFDRLAAFGDSDFLHDIYGIYRHLNRRTGKLENFFLPRCARQE